MKSRQFSFSTAPTEHSSASSCSAFWQISSSLSPGIAPQASSGAERSRAVRRRAAARRPPAAPRAAGPPPASSASAAGRLPLPPLLAAPPGAGPACSGPGGSASRHTFSAAPCPAFALSAIILLVLGSRMIFL